MRESMERWMETAVAQLRCRRAVPGIRRELEAHMEEQYAAYLREGCAPPEAEKKTVESMGDPVLTGGALDSVHRPRPVWGPFAAVAVLMLLGGMLPLLCGEAVRPRTLTGTVLAVGALALVCLCGDISLLARWPGRLYTVLLAGTVLGLSVFGVSLNGRLFWQLPMVGAYGALHFSILFIPVYAALLYRQHGRGWTGLLLSAFSLVPGVLVCLLTPHMLAAAALGLAGGSLCVACCARDWYGLGRRRSLAVLLGTAAASVCAAAGAACAIQPALMERVASQFALLFSPGRDAGGAGYWMLGVRRMWSGMQWLGAGDGALLLSEQLGMLSVGDFVTMGSGALCSDHPLAFIGWRWGKAAALALMLAVAGALCWLWRTALRTRAPLGWLCGVGCSAFLSVHALACLCVNMGWLPMQAMLPLMGGGVLALWAQAVVIGLMLSAFRWDNAVCSPQTPVPAAPAGTAAARRVAFTDGTLHIKFR